MIKSIVSTLFAFYAATNGNRLLQQVPAFVPGGGAPAEPQATAPGQVNNPSATAPAATEPATTLAAWQAIVLPNAGAGPSLEFNCNSPYNIRASEPNAPLPCSGQYYEFTNPPINSKLECSALGACASTQLVYNLTPANSAQRIEFMKFTESYAGYGASIVVNNESPIAWYIDRLECKGAGACANMQLKLIGASLNDVDCEKAVGACTGCQVEICKMERNNAGELVEVCEPKKPCNLW